MEKSLQYLVLPLWQQVILFTKPQISFETLSRRYCGMMIHETWIDMGNIGVTIGSYGFVDIGFLELFLGYFDASFLSHFA